jgi:hypothetical protein
MIHYSHRATLDGKRFAGGKEKLEMFYGLEQSGHEARIFYTRSYYRKESAASPPRDERQQWNLLNKGLFI